MLPNEDYDYAPESDPDPDLRPESGTSEDYWLFHPFASEYLATAEDLPFSS